MWEGSPSTDRYNLYRGRLTRLRSFGLYTQNPETEDADQFCDIEYDEIPFVDSYLPVTRGVFYLVTLSTASFEGTLGHASSGLNRPNANPCP